MCENYKPYKPLEGVSHWTSKCFWFWASKLYFGFTAKLCINLATEVLADWAEGRLIVAHQVGAKGYWADDLVVAVRQ